MQYLLIDFGATSIKCATYNGKKTCDAHSYVSPFIDHDTLSLGAVKQTLINILSDYPHIDSVLTCSILGGYYVDDIYYSWKHSCKPNIPDDCLTLIDGIFYDQSTWHVHHNHGQSLSIDNENYDIKLLGTLNGKKFWSALGDTNCVIQSIDLKHGEYIVNMGTGSQIITLDKNGPVINFNKNYSIISHIPSGRSLNILHRFFKELNCDMFEHFNKVTSDDIVNSTLMVDLNMFPQSYKYRTGGSISNINEDNFTIHNLIASILNGYIDQYINIIPKNSHIHLTGGIGKKVHTIKEVLLHNNYTIDTYDTLDTHRGMAKLIDEYIINRR